MRNLKRKIRINSFLSCLQLKEKSFPLLEMNLVGWNVEYCASGVRQEYKYWD